MEKIGEGNIYNIQRKVLLCLLIIQATVINIIIAILYVHKFILGTYGTVFKAKNKETQEIVALKRVRLDDDDEVIESLSYPHFLGIFTTLFTT